MTLAEVCNELEEALEHERSEVRDWWTMQRLLRALVALGAEKLEHHATAVACWELNPDQDHPDQDRFNALKAKAQEVLGVCEEACDKFGRGREDNRG
jgi:hypothetical protein